MLAIIQPSPIPEVKIPSSQLIKNVVRNIESRGAHKNTNVIIIWDVYRGDIRARFDSELIDLTVGEQARSIIFKLKYSDRKSFYKMIITRINELRQEFLYKDLTHSVDPQKTDILFDLFDGKRVDFEQLYPVTSWPKDLYTQHYERFLDL